MPLAFNSNITVRILVTIVIIALFIHDYHQLHNPYRPSSSPPSSSSSRPIMPLAFNSNNAVSRHFLTKSPIGLSAETYTTMMIMIKVHDHYNQSDDHKEKKKGQISIRIIMIKVHDHIK